MVGWSCVAHSIRRMPLSGSAAPEPLRRRNPARAGVVATVIAVIVSMTAVARPTPALADPPVDPYQIYRAATCQPFVEQPGVVAFRAMLNEHYGIGGGIHACSGFEHGEGRALDWMVNHFDPVQDAMASEVLDWLLATDAAGNPHAMARRLGIGNIIWNGQSIELWSYNAAKVWEPYLPCVPGSAPGVCHTNHIHIAFSWAGALQQTSWFTTTPRPAEWYPDAGSAPVDSSPRPAAVVFNDQINYVARTAAGNVVHGRRTQTGWQYTNLGGFVTSPPSIGVYNGSLYVVASNAGTVFQIWLIGSSWTSWIPISTGSDPVIQVFGPEYHVLSRLADGSVLNSWYSGGNWAFQNLAFRISSRPVAAVYNGEFHVVGSYGNAVYQRFYVRGGWSGPQQVSTGRDPTVVVYGREFHVVSRATGGNVVDRWYNGAGWQFQDFGGIIRNAPAAATYSRGFYVVGGNSGLIFQDWYRGSWSGWFQVSLGDWPIIATRETGGHFDYYLFSRLPSGLMCRWWNGSTWTTETVQG
jgi:hypothetical protein